MLEVADLLLGVRDKKENVGGVMKGQHEESCGLGLCSILTNYVEMNIQRLTNQGNKASACEPTTISGFLFIL